MKRAALWAMAASTGCLLFAAAIGSAATTAKPPIVIGYISQESGSVATYPESTVAMEAAVSYINKELHGANGRQLKLDVCVTDGTPASSQSCAQKMVQDKVLFVQQRDYNMAAAYPILSSAKIPVIGGIPFSNDDFTNPDAHYFIPGSAAGIASEALYVRKFLKGTKSVGIILPGIAPTLAALPLLEKPLDAMGIKHDKAILPANSTDYLGPLEALNPSQQAAIIGFLPPAACIGLAQAATQANVNVRIISSVSCSSSSVYAAVGNRLDGWTLWGYGPDPLGSSPDAKLYQRVMSKYAPSGANLTGSAPTGFANVMTVYNNLLKPLSAGKLTAQTMVRRLMRKKGGKVFLGPPYKCGQKSPYPAICTFKIIFFTVKNQRLVNPTPYLDPLPLINATFNK